MSSGTLPCAGPGVWCVSSGWSGGGLREDLVLHNKSNGTQNKRKMGIKADQNLQLCTEIDFRFFRLDLRLNTNTNDMQKTGTCRTVAKPVADTPSDCFQSTVALPEAAAQS